LFHLHRQYCHSSHSTCTKIEHDCCHNWRLHISKKYIRPGGMAPSEWTHSVRAVRETPVADYSVPGIKAMRRAPYRPLIAVSPFLLILWVSHVKRSLWRCG
jgi:hypothetical protein